MGSDPSVDKDAYDDEQPQHTLYLPDYHIAKTPITNAQYVAFTRAEGYQTTAEKQGYSYIWTGSEWKKEEGSNWQHPRGPKSGIEEKWNHPVVHISWHDAMAYCRWLEKMTGKPYGLPSEAQWEKAARGEDGRIYPWGNDEPSKDLLNYIVGVGDTTDVGSYPKGASPYGVLDMAGNVWEWARSLWGKDREKPDFRYPYNPEDGREDLEASDDVNRVLRGGAFSDSTGHVRCAARYWDLPFNWNTGFGFRCVLSPF